MITKYTCPHCRMPLDNLEEDGLVVIYCGNGPCESVTCNDGGRGIDSESAYEDLLTRYAENPRIPASEDAD